MADQDNPKIWKEAVVGFLITRCKEPDRDGRGSYHFVHMQPLIAESESGGLPTSSDATRLNKDFEIVGILPAPPGSAAVFGIVPNSQRGTKFEVLGYEIPGSTNPADWEAERQETIESWDKIAAEEASEKGR